MVMSSPIKPRLEVVRLDLATGLPAIYIEGPRIGRRKQLRLEPDQLAHPDRGFRYCSGESMQVEFVAGPGAAEFAEELDALLVACGVTDLRCRGIDLSGD